MLFKAVFIVALCFCLVACDTTGYVENSKAISLADEVTSSASAEAVATKKLNLYYSLNNYKLKKFEPNEGCFVGAYILADKSVGYDISQFELKTAPHASYKYHLKLGEDFPLSWLLTCYKENKLPFVIISPENEKAPYDYAIITEYAKKFGELNIPILIGFYPEPIKNNYSSLVYKSFFSYAKNEFNTYAPNTAFAFIMNSEEVYSIDSYFPDKNYVDWVGLNLYVPVSKENRLDNSSLTSLNYFYNKFQSKFPLMLSALGVSSFSTSQHKYYTIQAANEIQKIFTAIKTNYPRIKAVYYMDYNTEGLYLEDKNKNDKINYNNYVITNGDEVTTAYKRAVQNPHFINNFNFSLFNNLKTDEIASSQAILCGVAYEKGEELLVPKEMLEKFDLALNEKKDFENDDFVSLKKMEEEGRLEVDLKENGVVVREKK